MKNNIKHSIICKTHGPLIDTSEHCFLISKFFSTISHEGIINPISAWFDIASGLKEVKYISGLYDEDVMWCNPSIEYEEAKSKFHSKLICEITRFNFIWSGLESFIKDLDKKIPPCPTKRGRGQYNDINFYLKTEYLSSYNILKHHDELLEFLKLLIQKNPWYGKVNELFMKNNCTSKDLVGLKVVYDIRNNFAHGRFTFSEPDDYSVIKSYDIPIIITSCKIVLMYIQMLCLAWHKDQLKRIDIWGFAGIEEENMINAKDFLSELHLKAAHYRKEEYGS